jgi:hypothetical protein
MTFMLRLVPMLLAASLLAACASGSGVGLDENVASLNPSARLGSGPLTPKSLLGVAPSALAISLGPPAFKRSEPDAEVWQYSGGSCALFVYFYKTDAGSLASTYVDARKTTGGAADTSACLGEIVSRRSPPVS